MRQQPVEVGRGRADDLGEVLPGAEAAPRAGQEDRAAGLVGHRVVERGGERGGHLHRQRIQSLRPVQRDPAIPRKLLDENGHSLTPSLVGWVERSETHQNFTTETQRTQRREQFTTKDAKDTRWSRWDSNAFAPFAYPSRALR